MTALVLARVPFPRQRRQVVRIEYDKPSFSLRAREFASWSCANQSQIGTPSRRIDQIEMRPERFDRRLAPRVVHHDVAPSNVAARVDAVADRSTVLRVACPVDAASHALAGGAAPPFMQPHRRLVPCRSSTPKRSGSVQVEKSLRSHDSRRNPEASSGQDDRGNRVETMWNPMLDY